MTASPLSDTYRRAVSEIAAKDAPCPYCSPDPHEPCAECGQRAVAPVMPEAPPGFVIEDARQRYWDALAEDMKNPCLEDRT